MILEKFGIKLSSIQAADIEKVRQWRNADFVRENMRYKEFITPEMQRLWFSNLTHSDVYLMIYDEHKQLGIIHIKEIDWKQRSGEAGIFVGERDYLNTYFPMLAIITLMDAFFNDFGFSTLKAMVLTENKKALDFNQMLGYKIVAENEYDLTLKVTKEDYGKVREALEKVVRPFNNKAQNSMLTSEEKALFMPI